MDDPAIEAAARAILATTENPGVTWETVGEETRVAVRREATEAVAAWCLAEAAKLRWGVEMERLTQDAIKTAAWLDTSAAALSPSERG